MYDHSFRNNIEFGVYSEVGLLNNLTQSSDKDAWNACKDIADNGEPVFIKRPVFKKKVLGILGKDYISSAVLLDNTEAFYSGGSKLHNNKKLNDFEDELDFSETTLERPTRNEFEKTVIGHYEATRQNQNSGYSHNPNFSDNMGFCIRTGIRIPFDVNKPYSDDAYRSWARYKNPNYKEKFCHKTGKESHGKTSMNNPIL